MSNTMTDTVVFRRPKLFENVAQALREQILSGEFEIGARLPAGAQMAETFGVSRTVIREAVALLAVDKLVKIRQGAGVFVVGRPRLKISPSSADASNLVSRAVNVLEVRMGIEIESAGLAALRRSPSQEARIQEAFFEFERLLDQDQPTGKADFVFHREIAAATNNPFYLEVLDALGDRTIPCDRNSPLYSEEELSPEYLGGLQQEHLRILQAISAGNVAEARNAMRDHLTAAKDRYMNRLLSQRLAATLRKQQSAPLAEEKHMVL